MSVTMQPIPAATIFRIVLWLAWLQVSTMASHITNNLIFIQHVPQANKNGVIRPLLTILGGNILGQTIDYFHAWKTFEVLAQPVW